jgi:hypothetical protein
MKLKLIKIHNKRKILAKALIILAGLGLLLTTFLPFIPYLFK